MRNECGDSCSGSLETTLDHPAHVLRRQRPVSQPLDGAQRRAEQQPILILAADTGRVNIHADIAFQIMPHRDLPTLAPLLLKPRHVLPAVVLESWSNGLPITRPGRRYRPAWRGSHGAPIRRVCRPAPAPSDTYQAANTFRGRGSTKTPGRTWNASGAVLVALVSRSALQPRGSSGLWRFHQSPARGST
jgi:hypothetical protein